jgi:ribosomal-protein-alanine N-acetyltransferase
MIFTRPQLQARPATPADRSVVMTLARFERRVHSHLDWKPVEGWLGAQPFLLAEQGRRVVGALACPPDPPDTAWVRLFAVSDHVSTEAVWRLLWEQARGQLTSLRVTGVAGLSTGDWMPPLYQSAGFQRTHEVVVLARASQTLEAQRRGRGPLVAIPPALTRLRLARPDDHAALIAADQATFARPWQLSPEMIRTAIAQADLITVAEVDGRIVGYQLTTANRSGAHLARLAVLPEWQGQGLGAALVADMIACYAARGVHELTVNTQDSNAASLNVYQRLGFQLSGTRFPVFQLALR